MHDLQFTKLLPIEPWRDYADRTYTFKGCTKAAKAYEVSLNRLHGMVIMLGYAFKDGENWRWACDKAIQEIGNASDPAYLRKAEGFFNDRITTASKEETHRHFKAALGNVAAMWSKAELLHNSMHGMMQSMIIQAWSAYEVLCEDVWKVVLRERPSLHSRISNSKRSSIGFRSRKKIRESYELTFQSDKEAIMATLSPSCIDALAVVRCILVHSAGRIDSFFMRDSEGLREIEHLRQLPLDTEVEFDGPFTRKLIDPVTPCGFNLIQAVDNWLLFHP